jgi:hypothetical protein
MKIRRFKMMLYSIQSSAGQEKIRPEDGLPASNMNELPEICHLSKISQSSTMIQYICHGFSFVF